MTHYFTVPGLGNSDHKHWQSFFERSNNNFQRINQLDWITPQCNDWIAEIDRSITQYDLGSVVLIGHSLGSIAITHWANLYNRKIKGAMLVAPSDVESPRYNFKTSGFTPIPLNRIEFKTVIVASSDDPWVSLSRVNQFSEMWGSKLINIGNAGHINVASGHTDWRQGLEILSQLND